MHHSSCHAAISFRIPVFITKRNIILLSLLLLYTILILRLQHIHSQFTYHTPSLLPKKSASILTPQDLLSLTLATANTTTIPKLFHQSWSSTTLPAEFEKWSKSCRDLHPDWEWVLWTDEDNLALVEKYAEWFLESYKELRRPIFQADAVRNLYMHVFGGVYADLDVECLLPTETLISQYGNESQKQLFLGQMGLDDSKPSSLQNAWLASSPGHPFWLLTLEHIQQNLHTISVPEDLTGPQALFEKVNEYLSSSPHDISTRYAGSPLSTTMPLPERDSPGSLHTVTKLPFWEIYPYSWGEEGRAYIDYCWQRHKTFDDEKCKSLLGTEHWGSHAITYWSHSWGEDGKGHDPGELGMVDSTWIGNGF